MDYQAHWRGRARYAMFDSGYGDGAAFAAVLAAWRADPERPGSLHYIALAGAGDGTLPGFRRIPQPDARVTLDLLYAAPVAALEQLEARLDAVCLHAMPEADANANANFARALARLSRPGTLLAGRGLPAALEAALGAAGFVCQPGPGARQVTALFASRKPARPVKAPTLDRRAVVIGAGLAGSAACERLCARGWQVTLVERHAQPAGEASGNRAGIFMPLLSKDDSILTRVARAAYLYANAYWEQIGGIGGDGAAIEGARCGVLQLARDAAHGQVQRELAAARRYPAPFAEWFESAEAGALLGSGAPHGAWLFRQGGWARPASVCAAMLAACGARLDTRFGAGSVTLAPHGGQWQVRGAGGALLAQAPVAVLANGAGASGLAQAAGLPLAAVRGQVTHLDAGAAPDLPFVLCREAYLTPAARGVVSLGASYDQDGDGALREASQIDNLAKIRALLSDPAIGLGAPLRGRVGFRSVAPDRLPLVGALPLDDGSSRIERLRDMPRQPGLYGLLGFASRGLIWAPLAAELLAAQLDGEPLPLEAGLARALDPARFLLRERRLGARR